MPCPRLPLVSRTALSWSRRSDRFSPREGGCRRRSHPPPPALQMPPTSCTICRVRPTPADGSDRALSAVLDAVQTAVGCRLRSGDNLFEHGCTSVKAMRLAAALEIPIAAIFANPTPRGIVRIIAERQHDAPPPPPPAPAVALTTCRAPTPQPVVAPNKAAADAAALAAPLLSSRLAASSVWQPVSIAGWRCGCRAALIAWASSGNSYTPPPI